MKGTNLSNISDFSKLRPEHVHYAIMTARKYGATNEQAEQIQAAIAHLLEDFKKREERYADNSIRQLKTNWKRFLEWCIEHDYNALPAASETVELFLESKKSELHRNTLKGFAWAISKTHRITGCPDPMLDEVVRDKMVAILRKKVKKGERITQASPFHEHHLDKITVKWRHSPSLSLRRNLSILTTAYETMLRSHELANIKFGDLAYEGDGTAVLTIPITKSNHSGEPDTAILSREAVEIITEYLDMAQLDSSDPEAHLFVGISKHNTAFRPKKKNENNELIHKPLTTQTIEVVFNQAWAELNLGRMGIPTFTGHSARVGACQDLLREGYTILQVQQAGRWSTPAMVMRYGRGILAKEGAMALKRAHRGQNI